MVDCKIFTLAFLTYVLANPYLIQTKRNDILPPAEDGVQQDSSLKATACSPAVLALASGISANIADQHNEQAAVNSLGSLLAENPINENLFNSGQASLLSFVQKGISIRENNQAIAPDGNPAIPGLAIVATAQITELNLTMSFGVGGVNVQRDNATVQSLISEFKGGVEQNMKNLAAVSRGPTTTSATY